MLSILIFDGDEPVPINIDAFDERVTQDDKGNPIPGAVARLCQWFDEGNRNRPIIVNGNLSLDVFLGRVKAIVDGGNDKIGILSIYCHGFGERSYNEPAEGEEYLHGCFGLEFCQERINLGSVGRFRELKGRFQSEDVGIRLMSCDAAAEAEVEIAPKRFIKGFGRRLCQLLAEATGTSVLASDSHQSFNIEDSKISGPRDVFAQGKIHRFSGGTVTRKACMSWVPWRGDVWIFSPRGKQVKVVKWQGQLPAGWKDILDL